MSNLITTSITRWFTRIAIGGVAVTGLIVGGIQYGEFTSGGAASTVVTVVAQDNAYAFVTGTGSTTVKYPAACFPNPLASIGQGSGVIFRLDYMAGNVPAGNGGDIGFVKSCGNSGGSGNTLIDNTCTSTGCISTYVGTTSPITWNGADYIKFTPRSNLTSAYTGRIRVQYGDLYGE